MRIFFYFSDLFCNFARVMGKGKLAKFSDLDTYENVFQYPFSTYEEHPFKMQGRWRKDFFGNDNPIVLELGCGKGEYAVGLARNYPEKNFIGVDIKGARLWTGATQALKEGLKNVAFLRTNIEIIDRFFTEDEVQEIWLTFSDPQMKNPRKRLTSTYFLERYRHLMVDGGIIHLKTDSNFLFTYTTLVVEKNGMSVDFRTENLYHDESTASNVEPAVLSVQTYYESMWIDRGLNIKYMRWHLSRVGTLKEPDVEIELDDYRSYHRNKRSPLDKAK